MMVADHRTFFFLHVMKTAGTTFNQYLDQKFDPAQVFPGPTSWKGDGGYWHIDKILSLTDEQRSSIRLFRGHFPFIIAERFRTPDYVILSILREPVDRTISFLAMRQRRRAPHLSLEAIYDDAVTFENFIHDHMTKVFSFTPADSPRTYFDPMVVDDTRLDIAKRNLARVDVLGFQDRLDDMLAALHRRFAWRLDGVSSRNIGQNPEVSAAFRRRIEDENRFDLALYEYAQELHAAR
jgi:hypothetical protein